MRILMGPAISTAYTHSQSSVADEPHFSPVSVLKLTFSHVCPFPKCLFNPLPFKMSSILHKSYQNLLSHKDILYRSGFYWQYS